MAGRHGAGIALVLAALAGPVPGDDGGEGAAWPEALLAILAERPEDLLAGPGGAAWRRLEADHPVPCDWALADGGPSFPRDLAGPRPADFVRALAIRASAGAGGAGDGLRAEIGAVPAGDPGALRALLDIYVRAARERRAGRLAGLSARFPRIVFAKHLNLGGSHYAYTEGLSDAQAERQFEPGSSLCLLELKGTRWESRTLLEDRDGIIRDPDVDFDGRRILFAWKDSDRGDDYHLHEMDAGTGTIRAITRGPGHADYEGIYLPDGEVLFNSTRPVQTVDCWWTEVSNLYRVDRGGRFPRRIAFDQVHDNSPSLLDDGRVIYTRWEYNDRGQIYVQALFSMNPDGTGQTAFYGNNSWFPTTILHARGIPGTTEVAAILTGHHSIQAGKLAVIDAGRGTEENLGVRLIAPERPTPAVRVDAYGQEGDLFQYPWPLSEDEFLVAWSPFGHARRPLRFGIYWMARDGRRELLHSDPAISSSQPVPLAPRRRPPVRSSTVDPGGGRATCFLQDVYDGPGLAGIPRGEVKRLRVVALEFRAAGIRRNFSAGPGGAALSSTPVSVGNGAWDVKVVLGEAAVEEDGSALFTVPARTPVYFQPLDVRGRALQTMRSWSTLQPGETASCIGCHEPKGRAPRAARPALALGRPPDALPPPGPAPRGFSFPRDVQPILDRRCVSCHKERRPPQAFAAADPSSASVLSPLEAEWRWTVEDPGPGWTEPRFDDRGWRTGRAGFGLPGTPGGKIGTRWETGSIWLRREFDLPPGTGRRDLAFWCAHDEDVEIHLNGVPAAAGEGLATRFRPIPLLPSAAAAVRSGRAVLAVRCRQTAGGQFIDVALLSAARGDGRERGAFSLLGETTVEEESGRAWSDAYLALTGARGAVLGGNPEVLRADPDSGLVRWVGAQSAPPMLAPRSTGAVASPLLAMLDGGHHDVRLAEEEMATIACWIDLAVPYCGDYAEASAWNDEERARERRLREKRRRAEEEERAAIAELLRRSVPGTGGRITDNP